jgi:hypothetical protein
VGAGAVVVPAVPAAFPVVAVARPVVAVHPAVGNIIPHASSLALLYRIRLGCEGRSTLLALVKERKRGRMRYIYSCGIAAFFRNGLWYDAPKYSIESHVIFTKICLFFS